MAYNSVGGVIVGGTIENVDKKVCRLRCAMRPDCKFYTWSEQNNTCLLQNGFLSSTFGPVSSNGLTAWNGGTMPCNCVNSNNKNKKYKSYLIGLLYMEREL